MPQCARSCWRGSNAGLLARNGGRGRLAEPPDDAAPIRVPPGRVPASIHAGRAAAVGFFASQQSALRHAHSSVARSIEGTNPILWTRRAPAPHSSETAKLRQRPLPRRRRRLQQQPTWRRAARPATPGFEPPAPQAAAAQPPAALQRPPRGPPPRCA